MSDLLPCCNYREELDMPCGGTMHLANFGLEYVCDSCGARCGRLAHPDCRAAVEHFA